MIVSLVCLVLANVPFSDPLGRGIAVGYLAPIVATPLIALLLSTKSRAAVAVTLLTLLSVVGILVMEML